MYAPSYYQPTSVDHLAEVIVRVASEFPTTPIIYYHIPRMYKFYFPCSEILSRANAQCPNVRGAKFTETDMEDLRRCCELGFNMLSGDDKFVDQGYATGADGTVGAAHNFHGPLLAEIRAKA